MKRLSRLLTTAVISAVSIQCIGGINVFAASGVAINSKNFPDDNFRAVVADKYDSDGNGYLSECRVRGHGHQVA